MIRFLVLIIFLSAIVYGQHYKVYCVGNCNKDAIVPTKGGTVLMGGGADVDAAFVWMIERSMGGDFVIIRTDDDDLYNPYVMALSNNTLNSVTSLVILDRKGSFDPAVAKIVQGADAIFLAGGNQWTYYTNWKNTPVMEGIQALINKPGPIGGTSAGMMSLAQCLFTAQFDTIESDDALQDPYIANITIGNNFFANKFLTSTINDAHFENRDRMGRLVTFVARMLADFTSPDVAHGIGVNEMTAILIDDQGIGSLRCWDNTGGAFLLTASVIPSVCTIETPLSFAPVDVVKLNPGNYSNVFDFNTWSTIGNHHWSSYTLKARDGDLSSSSGDIYGN